MHTQRIVLGTAGHIDHGKTALVRALTGIDTDRLKVEKERGITTELGFAHLDLDGRRFGFVDVPGHERFIKSMVAGAGGIDLVVLAIAADEGIMPQTREHLDICELLGVRRGVVALTKCDLVDDEWLALVTEEVRSGLAGSFLSNAPIVPVSARTGAGLDALRGELARAAEALPARSADGVFRLPLDRVFTIRGFGTVATGTVLSGTVRAGDAVIAHPRAVSGKVRGLQVHGEKVSQAAAGVRCAVNLSGVAREQLVRGDWLVHPGTIEPSHLIDARFRYLTTSRAPLGRRSRVLLHHGTTQVLATVVLVDADRLEPGAEGLVQIRVDATTPLTALPGDRFIARGFEIQEHYGTTIGGGEVLRVHAPKVRRSSDRAREALRAIAAAEGSDRIALEIRSADVAGIATGDLVGRLGLSAERIAAAVDELVAAGDVVRAGDLLCHAEPFARVEARARALVDERGELPREELRARLPRSLPQRVFDEVIAALVRRGAVEAAGDTVKAARRGRAAAGGLSPLARDLRERFRQWGVTPPRPKEIAGDPRAVKAAIDELVRAGDVVRVKMDLYVAADAIRDLERKLVAHLDAHGQITPAEWKAITGASRKYSIPLAEYFDQQRVTLRVGDVRTRRG
ncbi:MAG: selenocysteine-specific translation elongation factor [Deltaproteobacteria bacterium]|nr:MAG: selenocysteine-specific translation elongation factor [Deltaproteobacteria bacterium]